MVCVQKAAAAVVATNLLSLTNASANHTGIRGFNYGATFTNNQAKQEVDFAYEFQHAQALTNTSGWTSARLYTMVQPYTASDPIQAIPAAISTQTKLLLGMWVSGNPAAIDNEIAALQAAIAQHGAAFTDLVQGISVGSEDLYRDANPASRLGPGLGAAALLDCVARVRAALATTALAAVPVGHVDTYDAFANASNAGVVAALDWVGFDGYPYWERDNDNPIEQAAALFFRGEDRTTALARGKPVWVTETGWPASGQQYGKAVPSAANARRYWTDVVCKLLAAGTNLWYYDLQQSQYGQADPDFGIYPAGDLNTAEARWDLSC